MNDRTLEAMRSWAILILLPAFPLQAPLVFRAQSRTLSGTPFTSGETLTYELTWRIFPAGTVTATLTRSGEGPQDPYEVRTTAQSRGFVSLLYSVQDEFRSSFNPETICSYRIAKRINEGRRHKQTEIVFDRSRKLAILDEHDLGKPGSPPKHAENAMPPCTEDVVTAFYYVRRQALRVGDQIRLPVNDGSRTSDVRVDVQARESIETPLGTRQAIRVEPTVFSGLLARKGRMLVWFSDDEQHLPLRIRAVISMGVITANLRSVKTVATGGSQAP